MQGMEFWQRENGPADFLPLYSERIDVAIDAAETICKTRRMFWRAHSLADIVNDDTDYWFGFTRRGFTGWNGRSEYEGHGPTLPIAICHAILELSKKNEEETDSA
jgi:hypothetical protein